MAEFRAPRLMGIINCTPDSFYGGSRAESEAAVLESARRMIADGADILDIGGESTRPGALAVDDEEQIRRVIPAITAIRRESDIDISIDTRSATVAEAALDAGAGIINDISSFSDKKMPSLAAERAVPVILMHMQGLPENMQDNPSYENVAAEVRIGLERSASIAEKAGIPRDRIILDPGIGFGKRHADNLALLARMERWRPAGYPILIGLSRKSFLGRIVEADRKQRAVSDIEGRDAEGWTPAAGGSVGTPDDRPEDRLASSAAAHAWCLTKYVDILRVHDVKETRQLIAVWEALAWAS